MSIQKIRDKMEETRKLLDIAYYNLYVDCPREEEKECSSARDLREGWLAGLSKAELLYERWNERAKDDLFPIIFKGELNTELSKLEGKTDAFNKGIREALEWSKTVM